MFSYGENGLDAAKELISTIVSDMNKYRYIRNVSSSFIVSHFGDNHPLPQFESFLSEENDAPSFLFGNNNLPRTIHRTIEQAIEKAKTNEAWMKKYYNKVSDWLSSENSKYDKSGQEHDVWNVILDIQVIQCIHSIIVQR